MTFEGKNELIFIDGTILQLDNTMGEMEISDQKFNDNNTFVTKSKL